MHAVVGLGTADDHRLLRLADLHPVTPREFRRSVDRVASAGSEEDLAAGNRRDCREPIGKCVGDVGGEIAESRVMRERRELIGHRLRDLGAPVTDIGEPETSGGVEILVAIAVPHAGALTPRDHKRAACADRPHIGESVPQ
ncbi:Uncharacterised protein [Mycobacteroides abscessus subsp. abscessus]|nr:Uncharacterised protein [Mycobacteroides abscessus subsp. abscessus]